MAERMDQRREKGLTTRQHILAAATQLFAEAGYEAISIEAILGASAISRGALYHHFSGKDQLFAAVFEALEAEIAQASIEAARGIADPVERLRAGCRSFLDLAGTPRVRQIVLIDAPAVLGWQKWREIEGRHGFGLLKASLNAAAKARGLKRAPLEEMAHLLLAALIEAALLVVRAPDSAAAARATKAALDRMIDGMLA
jgi:AcrR family transcriptional regulator